MYFVFVELAECFEWDELELELGDFFFFNNRFRLVELELEDSE